MSGHNIYKSETCLNFFNMSILTTCPSCGCGWGIEEIEDQECGACGYPNENDDSEEDDDMFDDTWVDDIEQGAR